MSKCYFCDNELTRIHPNYEVFNVCECPCCGKYILSEYFKLGLFNIKDLKFKISSFLVHHKFNNDIFFLGNSESYIKYKEVNPDTESKMVTLEEINNWYPKNFFEKIRKIILLLSKYCKFEGDIFHIKDIDKYEIFLCDVEEAKSKKSQYIYLIQYLKENKYINQNLDSIQLLPNCYKEIYTIEKNNIDSKNAFVAMQFGEQTVTIREAIRKGISDAGYNALYIDEKIHNHQIVPVMLDEIKKAKFLVMDCSYNNFGAYYEAGIALGLGKEVIITCRKDKLDSSDRPHFDIAQKQILCWDNEEDLSSKLTRWIKAVIS